MKEVPIEIRYAKLPIWTDWYFYLFIFFYLKLLPFQVAHLNFIFQHNAAPFHPPAREEEKNENKDPNKYTKLSIWADR